jgi:hypothetical protein
MGGTVISCSHWGMFEIPDEKYEYTLPKPGGIFGYGVMRIPLGEASYGIGRINVAW